MSSHRYDYTVEFHSLLKAEFFDEDPRPFFIIDKNILEVVFDLLPSNSYKYVYEASERNKTLKKAIDLYEWLLKNGCGRTSSIVAIGGGVTQDLAGFVASTFYRGISWVYFPTTLLSQADSCIGSKTSLNFEGAKNILGTFYPPRRIVICSEFLKTLQDAQYRSGVGEIVKVHLIDGPGSFFELKNGIHEILTGSPFKFVQRSLEIKRKFIDEDEFDRGKRIKLNLGHTFGHAIESLSGFSVPHGQAVLYGIKIATKLSRWQGILSSRVAAEICEICDSVISETYDVPVGEMIKQLQFDKKTVGAAIRPVLLSDEFRAVTEHEFDFPTLSEVLSEVK